jgi:hypothetical protein
LRFARKIKALGAMNYPIPILGASLASLAGCWGNNAGSGGVALARSTTG